MDKLSSGYRLPKDELNIKPYQIKLLHKHLMSAATYWAKCTGSSHSIIEFQEAIAYAISLETILLESEEFESITEEHNAMLFGKRPECNNPLIKKEIPQV